MNVPGVPLPVQTPVLYVLNTKPWLLWYDVELMPPSSLVTLCSITYECSPFVILSIHTIYPPFQYRYVTIVNLLN